MISWWRQFFFAPINAAGLGFFRICFGVVTFLALLGRYPDREMLYGVDGLVSRATSLSYFSGFERVFNLAYLVPGQDPWLMLFFVLLLTAAVALTLGFFTRTSTVILFFGLAALSNRNLVADNSGDDLMRDLFFFMMFAPAGRAYALDRLIAMRRLGQSQDLPLMVPWAYRLMQLQVAFVYLDTFYLKMLGPSWRDGTAVYYAFNYIEMQRYDLRWLLPSLWAVKLATWSTLVVEAAMGFFVWVRPLRYWCVGAAFLMHIAINFTMQLPIFQYVMMAALVLFIEPVHVERALKIFERSR